MCGRMTLTTADYESVARELDAEVTDELRREFRPRFNVAPGDRHWIVCFEDGGRTIQGATWGFLRDDGGLLVNARSETVSQRPSYRVAFLQGRCCVLADGFYEWSGPRNDRHPWWFHDPHGRHLLLAALYVDILSPATGRPERRFTVLTTPANREVRDMHDRMPAVIPLDRIDGWLRGSDEQQWKQLIRPVRDGTFSVRPASKRVNRVENDDPSCLAETPAPPRQGSLFPDR